MESHQFEKFLTDRHEPAFRLAQAKRAFFVDLLAGWDELTVFPKALRQACTDQVPWQALTVADEIQGRNGQTEKYLFICADDARIETVLMRHEDERNTVCVSSQVGCAMACGFCATGKLGLKRNLTSEEIYEQVIQVARRLKVEGKRVTNVVVMGMGEPFNNYDAVMEALRVLNDPQGFNLGARHMTVSTCGVVPGILRFATEPLQINLAVSLHAADDALRSRLMPVNRAYSITELMDAIKNYMDATNRRVTFEYLLLDGINDRPQDAQTLADLLEPVRRLSHVNLIRFHPTQDFAPSNLETRNAFLEVLRSRGINATHRVSLGEDIQAACGQLAGHGF